MEYLALTLGVLTLFVAWRSSRQLKALAERLDATNNRYFALVNRVHELDDELQSNLLDLRVEMKRQAGLLKFEPQMTIGEISALHPHAADVLASFHLGGCASCAVSPDQTLTSAAQQHNINLDLLMGSLKQLEHGTSSAPKFQSDPDLRIISQ